MTYAIGDRVRIARRLCSAEEGAVWEVTGFDAGRVVITSPTGFVLDVPTDRLVRATGGMMTEPALRHLGEVPAVPVSDLCADLDEVGAVADDVQADI